MQVIEPPANPDNEQGFDDIPTKQSDALVRYELYRKMAPFTFPVDDKAYAM